MKKLTPARVNAAYFWIITILLYLPIILLIVGLVMLVVANGFLEEPFC